MGQHGVGDGRRQRVTAEGGAMGAWLEDLRPGLFRQHRADREAAPQPFGAGEDVRDDVVMLVGVEMAGTPGAGLHLIEYQGGVMAIAEARSAWRNAGSAGITPPSPIIGSTITAQVREEIAAVTASISL